jgi:hypothetical protein
LEASFQPYFGQVHITQTNKVTNLKQEEKRMKFFKSKLAMIASTVIILNSFVLPVSAAGINDTSEISQTDETYDFAEEVTTFSDLGIMYRAWEEFIAENPNSTEADQEEFLIQFVESGALRQVRNSRGVGDYIPGYNNLNPAEKELLLKHPLQAIQVFNCANNATDATIEYYGTNGWQDNSDAFRHCCWNALMKKAIGESAADEWATAHEYESSGIDKEMDLFNNTVGRSIDVTGKSDSEIYNAVKEKVVNGNCQRIVNNELVPTNADGLIK